MSHNLEQNCNDLLLNFLHSFHFCVFYNFTVSFLGDDCSVFSHDLPSYIKDNFESERVTEINWETIQGGVIGNGCGQLAPYAHGDSLYFNGCQIRQAVTKPLDLTRAR